MFIWRIGIGCHYIITIYHHTKQKTAEDIIPQKKKKTVPNEDRLLPLVWHWFLVRTDGSIKKLSDFSVDWLRFRFQQATVAVAAAPRTVKSVPRCWQHATSWHCESERAMVINRHCLQPFANLWWSSFRPLFLLYRLNLHIFELCRTTEIHCFRKVLF